ncbi:MobC family plasmid mobilization relaxosome protein [Oceanidesulfovibrio marinus]|uniref:MobC family plasmid mobilization relaxosome protein n=1 Tax=Oceanidesulfovibrio marinus TaxID=370038 RepID=A0ABX6NFZ1_9BACT|nr:MobC family plasmid mobilization relaxosome protein [Oceanidesulfovibrio marinus]QJT09508.1 MobC family plasmid mobilization relaxosome protein [Oceanidesulfovibrio marinus]
MSRDQWIKIRVSEEEKAQFEAKAAAAGMTLADLVRHRLASFRLRKTSTEREALLQLARIGNNLNQIARWVNTYKGGLDTIEVVSRLDAILRELRLR